MRGELCMKELKVFGTLGHHFMYYKRCSCFKVSSQLLRRTWISAPARYCGWWMHSALIVGHGRQPCKPCSRKLSFCCRKWASGWPCVLTRQRSLLRFQQRPMVNYFPLFAISIIYLVCDFNLSWDFNWHLACCSGSMLLTSVTAQFPGATGLKFRNPSTNTVRGVRMQGEVCNWIW